MFTWAHMQRSDPKLETVILNEIDFFTYFVTHVIKMGYLADSQPSLHPSIRDIWNMYQAHWIIIVSFLLVKIDDSG